MRIAYVVQSVIAWYRSSAPSSTHSWTKKGLPNLDFSFLFFAITNPRCDVHVTVPAESSHVIVIIAAFLDTLTLL